MQRADSANTWGLLVLQAVSPIQSVITPMLAARVVGDVENRRSRLPMTMFLFALVTVLFIVLNRMYTLQRTTATISLQVHILQDIVKLFPSQSNTTTAIITARNASIQVAQYIEVCQSAAMNVVSLLMQSVYLMAGVDAGLGLCLFAITASIMGGFGVIRDCKTEEDGVSMYDTLEEILLNLSVLDVSEELKRLVELGKISEKKMKQLAKQCIYKTVPVNLLVMVLCMVYVKRMQVMTKTHDAQLLVSGITIFLAALQKIDESLVLLIRMMLARATFQSSIALLSAKNAVANVSPMPGKVAIYGPGKSKHLQELVGEHVLLTDTLLSRKVRDNFMTKGVPIQVQQLISPERDVGRKGQDLSWTERRVILIARALQSASPVLLIDRPYMGLNLKGMEAVHEMIVKSPKTITVTIGDTEAHGRDIDYDKVIRLGVSN